MAQVTVQIRNMAYSPTAVQVAQGDTVHWVNDDPATHTATADNGEFDSGDLGQGDAFDHTFNGPPRTVPYGCQYHPGMRGAIIVT